VLSVLLTQQDDQECILHLVADAAWAAGGVPDGGHPARLGMAGHQVLASKADTPAMESLVHDRLGAVIQL
jgi:hypothetical protein